METITFYRRMINSNSTLMKKYKYNEIKKLTYNQIQEIYLSNKIDLNLDVIRLKNFINGDIIAKDVMVEDVKNIQESVFEPPNSSDVTQLEDTEENDEEDTKENDEEDTKENDEEDTKENGEEGSEENGEEGSEENGEEGSEENGEEDDKENGEEDDKDDTEEEDDDKDNEDKNKDLVTYENIFDKNEQYDDHNIDDDYDIIFLMIIMLLPTLSILFYI